tara:strand:+ start:1278 stop:1850 length:573 start_codon:yes stop_codon:yes gene_type:complete
LIVNKQNLKSDLGVEIVERTLEGLGYTMAHTKEKYSPYDLVVTKVTDQKSELPDGGFPADVKTYTFTTKTKQVSIKTKQYYNYCDIGELYDSPFYLFIVDELHDGVFAIDITNSFPETSRFSNIDLSLRKKFSMGQSIKLRSLNFDEKRKLKKYRTIQDGNEKYYLSKQLKTPKSVWDKVKKKKKKKKKE